MRREPSTRTRRQRRRRKRHCLLLTIAPSRVRRRQDRSTRHWLTFCFWTTPWCYRHQWRHCPHHLSLQQIHSRHRHHLLLQQQMRRWVRVRDMLSIRRFGDHHHNSSSLTSLTTTHGTHPRHTISSNSSRTAAAAEVVVVVAPARHNNNNNSRTILHRQRARIHFWQRLPLPPLPARLLLPIHLRGRTEEALRRRQHRGVLVVEARRRSSSGRSRRRSIHQGGVNEGGWAGHGEEEGAASCKPI